MVIVQEFAEETIVMEKTAYELELKQAELINQNKKLVRYIVNRMGITDYDKNELYSEGFVGLVKAAKSFDPSKGYAFNTFAGRCIRNEVLMFLRSNNRHLGVESLEKTSVKSGEEFTLLETIDCGIYVDVILENREKKETLLMCLNSLSKVELEILLTVGLKRKTQQEVADELGCSQRKVSRLKDAAIRKIKEQLETIYA